MSLFLVADVNFICAVFMPRPQGLRIFPAKLTFANCITCCKSSRIHNRPLLTCLFLLFAQPSPKCICNEKRGSPGKHTLRKRFIRHRSVLKISQKFTLLPSVTVNYYHHRYHQYNSLLINFVGNRIERSELRCQDNSQHLGITLFSCSRFCQND